MSKARYSKKISENDRKNIEKKEKYTDENLMAEIEYFQYVLNPFWA